MPAAKKKILTAEQTDAVRQRIFANLIGKINAGKTLTAREQRLFEEHAAADPAAAAPDWVSSDSKLAEIFGPHRASFPRFRKEHKDAPRPRANGDHNVLAWKKFFEKHPELLDRAAGHLPPALIQIKEAIEAEKLRKLKDENDRKAGLYLPKAATLQALRSLGELQKSILRTALEDDLPAVIQHQPAAAVRTHMKELVDRLCRQFQETFSRL